jgi:hypothetical protein
MQFLLEFQYHISCNWYQRARDHGGVQSSSERIDDRNALDVATMAYVFGTQFAAPERAGGGNDGGVPIR